MEQTRYNAKRATLIGCVLSVILVTIMLAVDSPQSPWFVAWRSSYMMDPLHPVVSVVMGTLSGMGLGAVLTLILSNRKRLRAVFRPNAGRLVSGIAFGLLLPFMHVSGMPVTMLFPVGLFFANLGDLPHNGIFEPVAVAALMAMLAIGYALASLIISGVRSRLVRIALFGQVWLAAYGAVFMVFGYSVFRL